MYRWLHPPVKYSQLGHFKSHCSFVTVPLTLYREQKGNYMKRIKHYTAGPPREAQIMVSKWEIA